VVTVVAAIGLTALIAFVALYAWVLGHNAAMRSVLKDIDDVTKQAEQMTRKP